MLKLQHWYFDPAQSMITIFIHVFIIVIALVYFQPDRPMRFYYWSGALIKVMAGLILGWLYWKLGEGDTLTFHQKALELYQLFFTDYWQELFTAHNPVFKSEARTELFTKILSALYWTNGGNYWISATYLSLLSFAGAWQIIRQIRKYEAWLVLPAVIAFLWLPSAVFWTSGVLKDSLIAGALFYLMAVMIQYYCENKFSIFQYLLVGLSLLILFYLKFYLLATIGLSMGILAWWQLLQKLDLSLQLRWTFTFGFVIIMGLLVTQLNMNLHLDKLPQAIFDNYHSIAHQSETGTFITFDNLKPNWTSLSLHLSLGLWAGISRPYLWEVNWMLVIPATEHVIFILLLAFTFYKRAIPKHPLLWIGIFYCFILATFLPLVAPNFGSLIRYEAAYTSLLLFLLLIPVFQSKLLKAKSN